MYKKLSFQKNIFWSTSVEHFWKRCYRAFTLDRRGGIKNFLFHKIYFGQQMLNWPNYILLRSKLFWHPLLSKLKPLQHLFSKVFHSCWPKYILLKRKLFYISSVAPLFKFVPQLLTKIYSVEKKAFLHQLCSTSF